MRQLAVSGFMGAFQCGAVLRRMDNMGYLDLRERILQILREKEDVVSVSVGPDGTFRLVTVEGLVEFKLVVRETLNSAALPN